MEIIWSKSAKKDLYDYFQNSRIYTKEKVNSYIISLVEYIDTLMDMPKMGKLLFLINNIEIRQIIFKMHRILYSINDNKINILVVSHTSRDNKEIVSYIRKCLKKD